VRRVPQPDRARIKRVNALGGAVAIAAVFTGRRRGWCGCGCRRWGRCRRRSRCGGGCRCRVVTRLRNGRKHKRDEKRQNCRFELYQWIHTLYKGKKSGAFQES
jgi:hypothetical protein